MSEDERKALKNKRNALVNKLMKKAEDIKIPKILGKDFGESLQETIKEMCQLMQVFCRESDELRAEIESLKKRVEALEGSEA